MLDGWWAEGYDGTERLGDPRRRGPDHAAADARDAARFYELLESEVVPLFYDRDDDGIPRAWCERVKHALVTCAPRFSATRMVDDYVERIYPQF